MTASVISVQALDKAYDTPAGPFPVLKDVNLSIESGEFVAIMGPSGSGKSTFMNILGCLDRPSQGEYILDGRAVSAMSKDDLAGVRGGLIGFVFQGFNLLPRISLEENVALPLVYGHVDKAERLERARAMLTKVGLGQYAKSLPNRISGGQQQRVAIARALVNNPRLILADEPTGNLDTQTSEEIMTLFEELNREGITIVLVTHEQDIARHAKRLVRFRDGRIIHDGGHDGLEISHEGDAEHLLHGNLGEGTTLPPSPAPGAGVTNQSPPPLGGGGREGGAMTSHDDDRRSSS